MLPTALQPTLTTPAADLAVSTPFDDLAAVVAENQARIFRLLLFSLRDRHAAASLTQDTFLSAWRTRATFRGDCSPATWLSRIALNLAHNHTRGERFRFWQRAERSALDIHAAADLIASSTPAADATFAARQRLAGVFRVVFTLPTQQRTAFLLRFNDDLDLPEIAAAMDLSLSAAKTHLYRALDRVRRQCGPDRNPARNDKDLA